MTEKNDWADLFPEAADQKAKQLSEAIAFAQQYLVFEQDQRAKELLARWSLEIESRDINPAASHAEYAYWEGRRAFVRGIQRQIAMAHAPR